LTKTYLEYNRKGKIDDEKIMEIKEGSLTFGDTSLEYDTMFFLQDYLTREFL
jgi:hypothetical protein